MSTSISRRTLLALAGAGAVSTGFLRDALAAAQSQTSPFTFVNGSELTWADPWSLYEDNSAASILPDSAALQGGAKGELVVGYYETPTSIEDASKAFLALVLQDPSLAINISGGSDETVGAGGVVESQLDFLTYSLTIADESYGLYLQLINQLEVTAFIAPVSAFGSEMTSAQSSVQLDGVGVLGGVDGVEIQQELEAAAGTESPAAGGGTFTDASGFLQVTWTNDWIELSHNDFGNILTNPAQTIAIYSQVITSEGRSWQESADLDVAFLFDDQGASATLSGPEVTESGFSFATNGEYGLRFAEATPTESQDLYVLVFAADMSASGPEALALLQDAQASILVNGTAPLLGVEQFIEA